MLVFFSTQGLRWLPGCWVSPWLAPGTQLPAQGSHPAASLPRCRPCGLCHFPLARAAASCTGIGPCLQHSYPDWLLGGMLALQRPRQLRWVHSGSDRSGLVPNCRVKGCRGALLPRTQGMPRHHNSWGQTSQHQLVAASVSGVPVPRVPFGASSHQRRHPRTRTDIYVNTSHYNILVWKRDDREGIY